MKRMLKRIRRWTRDHRVGRCPDCERWRVLVYVSPMTCYVDRDGRPDECNYVGHLCDTCAGDYKDYWAERWEEYWQGQMVGMF